MREANSQAEFIGRRSELLAELFLQDLNPTFLSRPTQDFGLDFLIGFTNSKGGINTFGVEVKGTQKEVESMFALDKESYRRLANSNVPVCLLVVDAKQNRLFYSWPDKEKSNLSSGAGKVSVPVTEIDERTKTEFLKRMTV